MRFNFSLSRNTLLRDTFIYTVTDMLGKAMSFLLIPFLSFYLPPDELGIATNFAVLTSILTLLSGLAVVNSVPYFYYEQDKNENSLLISNLLYLVTILCVFLGICFIILSDYIYTYLQLDFEIQLLSIIFVYASLICQISLTLLRLEDKAKVFSILQIGQILLHTILVVLFVIVLRKGGVGKITAEVMAFFVLALVHFTLLVKKGFIGKRIVKKWQIKLISFGLPLLPHSLSFWFKGSTDKIFITSFWGLQCNGIYSMAMSISTIYTVLVNSFFNAYTPYLQKRLVNIDSKNEMSEKKLIIRQTYYLYGLFMIVALLSIVASWVILNYFVDAQYSESFVYIPYIIVSNFIYTFYNFAIEYIYKVKKTLVMGLITFTGSVLQMAISYYMIRDFGTIGAAYSLIIGTILITMGIFLYSRHVYYMPWFFFIGRK